MRTEAQSAINIVETAAKILVDHGVAVSVVPHTLALEATIKYINARWSGPNSLAVEVHKDSWHDPTVDGVSTWYETGSITEEVLARKAQQELVRCTGKSDRGVHGDRSNHHGRLGITRLRIDSLLFELGFGSSSTDLSDREYGVALASALLLLLGKTMTVEGGEESMYAKEHGHVVAGERSLQVANPAPNGSLNITARFYDERGTELEEQPAKVGPNERWGHDLPAGCASVVVRSYTGVPFFATRLVR
jgi:hypothetical protein